MVVIQVVTLPRAKLGLRFGLGLGYGLGRVSVSVGVGLDKNVSVERSLVCIYSESEIVLGFEC
jgi:hypothetical protein